jgi:predicted dehydrogenase
VTPVGVGFIGAGAVAELHRRGLERSGAGRLVALCGPSDDDLERARRWGVSGYREAEALVADPRVEAVFVLSPLEWHCRHALLALGAGKPVLVEKPVAGSLDEIARIRDEARRRGLPAVPAHNYVYDPALELAREAIAGGEFGRLCMTWIVYAIAHSEALASRYPGVLRQIVPHHLYTLLYLVGMPRRLVAASSRLHYEELRREDQVALQLEMADGSLAHLFASFAFDDETSQPWTFMVKTVGTGGGFVHTWRDAVADRRLATHGRAYLAYEESYRLEDEHFLRRCLRGEPPRSTLDDAYRVELLIEAAERSCASSAWMSVEQ